MLLVEKISVLKGTFWSGIERFSSQGIQFIISIVISRILLPREYGLIAMLSIFISLGQTFIDGGFGQALIQKKNRTEIDYSTAFFTNLGVSIGAYILLFIGAPLISSFYNEPELQTLARFVGINFIVSSFMVVQNAIISIRLDFRTLTLSSLIAVCVSGIIGIVLAINGFGVWALAIQALLSNVIRVMVIWIYSEWMPIFKFSIRSFKELFGFSSKILVSTIMHTLYLNMYTLVIGKFYNTSDVGLYNRANSLANFSSTNLTNVIQRVFYPVLCEQQDEDEKLKITLKESIRALALVVFPSCLLLALFAKPLLYIVFTPKWLSAAPLLSILAISFALYPLMSMNIQMLQVKGYSNLFLRAELAKKITAIILLVVSLKFGVVYLCLSILAYNICDYLIALFYVRKIFQTSLFEQINWMKDLIIIDFFTAVLAIAGILLCKNSYTCQLFVVLPICLLFYLFVASFTNEGKNIKRKICTKFHF